MKKTKSTAVFIIISGWFVLISCAIGNNDPQDKLCPEATGKRIAGYTSENLFNKVNYENCCCVYGVLMLAEATHDKSLERSVIESFKPYLTGKINPSENQIPAHRWFGFIPLKLYESTGDLEYLTLGKHLANEQFSNARQDGLTAYTRYWVDDIYGVALMQSLAYKNVMDPKFIDRGANQVLAYIEKLQHPNGLFYHSPEAKFFWGRGNGWAAAGMAELLLVMPKSHPKWKPIMQSYQKMMEGLLEFQHESGFWLQLMDHPESWKETSCTGMFIFAMATGIHQDWLKGSQYDEAVEKGWKALAGAVTTEGRVKGVCIGTGHGKTAEHYLKRPARTGDPHGQAAALWAASAMINLEKSQRQAPPKEYSVHIKNPIDLERSNERIVLNADTLKGIDLSSFSVFSGDNILPSQVVDTDYNGEPDAIAFIMDVGPREKTAVKIVSPVKTKPVFERKTHVELSIRTDKYFGILDEEMKKGSRYMPHKTAVRESTHRVNDGLYRVDSPLIESDKVGYRYYWWRHCAGDVFGKTSDLFIGDHHTGPHHTMQPWGRDLLHNGKALGIGGLGIGEDLSRISAGLAPDARIIVGQNGPIHSSFRFEYNRLKYKDNIYDINWDISISAGKRYLVHNVEIAKGGELTMLAAMTNHMDENDMTMKKSITKDNQLDWLGTWGSQCYRDEDTDLAAKSTEQMGMAILWPHDQLSKINEFDLEFQAVFKPVVKLTYYSTVAYNQENGDPITTSEEFYNYLNKLSTILANPVMVEVNNLN